jgi:hypothetical protein
MRSRSTATAVDALIATRNRIAIDRIGDSSSNPFVSRTRAKKNEVKAPTMKTSPCAKLIISRMP